MVSVVIRTGVGFMLVLKLKLLYRRFVDMSEVLAKNKINCMIFYMDFQVICLTDTCLKDICFDHKIFPFPHCLPFSQC